MGGALETKVVETRSAKGSFGFRFMAPLRLGSMLNPVNWTMISTALVAIARDFQATVAETGLLIGGLYITSAIAQPTMGRLADRLRARRVFLAGLYLVCRLLLEKKKTTLPERRQYGREPQPRTPRDETL